MVRKFIRMNWGDLAVACAVVAGAFLLIQLVIGGVMLLRRPENGVMISGVALPVVAGFMIFAVTTGNVMISLPMAVQLGRTRRQALGLTLSLAAAAALCAMALAFVLARLEAQFAPGLWKAMSGALTVTVGTEGRSVPAPDPEGMAGAAFGPEGELFLLDFSHVLPWWGWPLIALGAIAAGLIIGAVLDRFGIKGLWGIYALFFGGMLIVQRLDWRSHAMDWLNLPAVLTVLAAAALAWSVWSLLHTVIKS